MEECALHVLLRRWKRRKGRLEWFWRNSGNTTSFYDLPSASVRNIVEFSSLLKGMEDAAYTVSSDPFIVEGLE